MLLWERQFSLPPSPQTAVSKPIGRILFVALLIVIGVIAVDLISVILECGPGICPDSPPDNYPYWPF